MHPMLNHAPHHSPHQAHPVTGESFFNFALMHPRDHVSFDVSPLPIEKKVSAFHVTDVLLSGCKATDSALEPYACPSAAELRSAGASAGAAGAAALADAEHVNSECRCQGRGGRLRWRESRCFFICLVNAAPAPSPLQLQPNTGKTRHQHHHRHEPR